MKEEISKVLSMMQEGKIDSDKASELINALKEKQTAQTSQAVQVLGKLTIRRNFHRHPVVI